ncbi:aminotransferase class I/II-fold pyridoxal phosphate-dependent enzyme [Mesorhizobium camelthorni]|uniref:Aminotransferase n=2 Tax=Allomesorhizobium camelthorni TaxID=475069 RepID=A0A6G4WAR3_9HYPH|nr:aminotransferase class I/II-fold pyridoxal phosphate-dependent enzyme [Mesorhizobium camelthorni]
MMLARKGMTGQRLAYAGIRPQIMDLQVENIAQMAVRAQSIPDVITLWYGEGDVVTPEFIRAAAKASLDQGDTFYVPDMRGLPALTKVLSEYQSRLHGRDIPVVRSTITPGGMQSVFMALQLVAEMGSNVVYIEPQWPNIRNAIHVIGAEPRPVFLKQVNGSWSLDLEDIYRACDARTRAIMFSTPSNPLGWTATREELEALLEFSRESGVWIISDELYNRLYFHGEAAPSILQVADDEDRVMSVNGFSKAWAMTGWRIGWLTHPASVAKPFSAITQYMNSGTAAFVQAGAKVALEEGEAFAASTRDRCREGVDIAYRILGAANRIVLPTKPAGGMYVFFSVEGEQNSTEICQRFLEEARVGLAPGWLFGEASKAHMRMCVCRDPAEIEEACKRIVALLAA